MSMSTKSSIETKSVNGTEINERTSVRWMMVLYDIILFTL